MTNDLNQEPCNPIIIVSLTTGPAHSFVTATAADDTNKRLELVLSQCFSFPFFWLGKNRFDKKKKKSQMKEKRRRRERRWTTVLSVGRHAT